MLDGSHVADVPFDIGLPVGVEPPPAGAGRFHKRRGGITSCDYEFLYLLSPVRKCAPLPFPCERPRVLCRKEFSQDGGRLLLGYLRPHEGLELMERHPAGKGLRDLFEGHQVGGAGKQELPGPAVSVHNALYGTHEVGGPLHLVDYRRDRSAAYEPVRVCKRGIEHHAAVERKVCGLPPGLREHLRQGGFADLPCPGKKDYREMPEGVENIRSDMPLYHGYNLTTWWLNCQEALLP